MSTQRPLSPLTLRMETGQYKSLTAPMLWGDIPPFVVLYGQNGAGKTHLLDVIEQATKCSQQLKQLPPRPGAEVQRRIQHLQSSGSKSFGAAWLDGDVKSWVTVKIQAWELGAAQATNPQQVHQYRINLVQQLKRTIPSYTKPTSNREFAARC